MPRPVRPLTFGRMRNMAQIVHVVCTGTLLALSVAGYLMLGRVPPIEYPPLGLVLGGAFSILTVAIAAALPRFTLDRVPPEHVGTRLQAAVFTALVLSVTLEAAGIYWLALAVILGEPLYLAGPALALLVLIARWPSSAWIQERVGRSESEIDAILARG